MVTKRDWEIAYHDVMERGRSAPPPSPDEIDAYLRGDLSEEEMARIGESLTYYPELASALHDDETGAEVQVALTDAQLREDWASIQSRLPVETIPAPAPPIPFVAPGRRWQLATAASWLVTIAAGAWLLHSSLTIQSLRDELEKPRRNVEHVELVEGASRGGSVKAIQLQPSTRYLVLSLAPADQFAGDDFQIELLDSDASPARTIWRGSVSRSSDGMFSIEIPRSFLTGQRYTIDLYSGSGKPVATYEFWLPSQGDEGNRR
ncbi:MAG TPA: hypothetical protein VHW00_19930 [Thermoanaerobaculia bacterium]|nr:hypothetical protein [Thermoanaerobaculia bacterium]